MKILKKYIKKRENNLVLKKKIKVLIKKIKKGDKKKIKILFKLIDKNKKKLKKNKVNRIKRKITKR